MKSDLPVKTDSHVKIMSMSPLGDNHLEVVPGSAASGAGGEWRDAAIRPLSGSERHHGAHQ